MKAAPLYEKIASRIEKEIETGVLRPGDRVPSVRGLSQLEDVSVSTVLEAYMHLERRELIEARPQSGFYVKCPEKQRLPEPTVGDADLSKCDIRVADIVAAVCLAGNDPSVVALGTACPSPELLPVARLNRIYRDVLRDTPAHSSNYDFAPGLLAFRRQIARHARESGAMLAPDDIIVTCGAMEALTLCLRAVTRPGDAVLVESPTYFGILQVMESLQLTAIELPTHPRTGLDLDATEQALRRHKKIRAGVFMPTFNNPLGCLMPETAKRELVKLFSRYGLPIIEDDVYGELPHRGVRPPTLKKFDDEGSVLLCSSFSKTLASGMRLGWVAPGKYKDAVMQLKRTSTMASPALPALVLSRYLEKETYARHLRRLRAAIGVQTVHAQQAVMRHFPEGTKVSRPQGGFVLWVELPEGTDSLALYRRALKRKIGITPGVVFSAGNRHGHCFRLNCGLKWNERAEKAIADLATIARTLR